MLQRGAGVRGSSSPKTSEPSRARAPICGSSPFRTRRARAARDSARATVRRRSRARRSGRAGRERGCRAAAPWAGAARRPRAAPPRRPRTARARPRARARSVEATPETRFAPEALWATRTHGLRISATIALVVVLPFVAETRTEPCGRRPARRSIAPGSSFQRSFPGSVVPPPRPAARESAPADRSAADSTASGIGRRIARTVDDRFRRSTRPTRLYLHFILCALPYL